MSERNLSVFPCHSSQDQPIVRQLYQRPRAEDWIDPWLDEEKLLPGQDWDREIEMAVEAADAVLVCLSRQSVSKEGYIQRELKFVLDIALEKPDGTIFIIPIRLDACDLPSRLGSWQYVDYFPTSQNQRGYQRLLQSLRIRFDALQPEYFKGEKAEHDEIEETIQKEPVQGIPIRKIIEKAPKAESVGRFLCQGKKTAWMGWLINALNIQYLVVMRKNQLLLEFIPNWFLMIYLSQNLQKKN